MHKNVSYLSKDSRLRDDLIELFKEGHHRLHDLHAILLLDDAFLFFFCFLLVDHSMRDQMRRKELNDLRESDFLGVERVEDLQKVGHVFFSEAAAVLILA